MDKENKIEICRSFSYKLQIQGTYENRDFFCSAKAEVLKEDAEKVSKELQEFCQKEVVKSLEDYKKGPNVDGTKQWSEHRQDLENQASQVRDLGIETAEAESKK